MEHVEHVEHVTLGVDEFPGNIPGSLGFQSPDVMNFGWAKLGSADLSASQSRSAEATFMASPAMSENLPKSSNGEFASVVEVVL